MPDKLRDLIIEAYGNCQSPIDVATLYADIKLINQLQMEYVMGLLTEEDN